MAKFPFLYRLFQKQHTEVRASSGQQATDLLPNAPDPIPPLACEQKSDSTDLLNRVLEEFKDCYDLSHLSLHGGSLHLIQFFHLIKKDVWDQQVLQILSQTPEDQIPGLLNQSPYLPMTNFKDIVISILDGGTAVIYDNRLFIIFIPGGAARSVEQSETESVIVGPHDAFVESAESNLSLIRRRVKSSHLKVVKLGVGEVTKSDVYILYIQDITNMHFVNTMIDRIRSIEIDAVYDGNMLMQYIDDQPNSVFPQFLTTERTDTAASKLVGGRVVCIVDCSPTIITAPAAFFEFFSSPDDYYQRSLLGSATRLLRLVAFVITILFTAFYVSVTTFHYEMIPEKLIITLTESRSRVPFPPLFEALMMEVTIELLREAGARLPTKIGQTIGIVGGIVIGQAAVQAGFTSNILIIAVASSAIASFVVPSYVMSASIRLIRFGLIIMAGVWGNFGLMLGIAALTIHISGITSLGASYLYPIAPMSWSDWKDVFIRAPLWALKDRPGQPLPVNKVKNKLRK